MYSSGGKIKGMKEFMRRFRKDEKIKYWED